MPTSLGSIKQAKKSRLTYGSCLFFYAPSSQYAELKTAKILAGQTSYTISVWIKTTSRAGAAGMSFYCERAAAGNDIFKFGLSDTSTTAALAGRIVELILRDDAGTLQRYSTTTKVVNDGNWHHCVVTNSSGTIQVYIDTVPDSGPLAQTPTNNFTNASMKVRVGGDAGDATTYFLGNIDELQLYTTALTTTQIQQLYLQGGSISGAGLVGWYKFDEGSGSAVVDSSGTQSNGTITGALYTTASQ